jgi:DNA-binding transcriptional regulator YiaG
MEKNEVYTMGLVMKKRIIKKTVRRARSGRIVTEEDMAAGAQLRVLRKKLGMRREEMAVALGVSVDTVGNWERGDARPNRQCRFMLKQFCRERGIEVPAAAAAA